jgi:DNA polymerase III subunit beta
MFEFNFDDITDFENTDSINEEKIVNAFSLIVDRNSFLKAISHVQNVVEKKNIIPILANIRLIAKSGKLELMATDMDIAATEKIVAHIKDEGAITLSAQTLYDIVRKLPEGSSLEIKICDKIPGKVNISTNKSKFNLPSIDANDFPVIDQGVMPFSFFIASSELKTIIDKNKFAICAEETRYNLNGIYLHIISEEGEEDRMQAVATDGHRLSCVVLTTPEGAEKINGIIIPKKAVLELRKIIEDFEGEIKIELSDTKIKLSFGTTEFITKLIDGSFPEYSAFIPKNVSHTLEIDKKIMVKAIDLVTTVSFEKTRSVKFLVNKTSLELSVINNPGGDAKEVIDCVSDLENFEIAFNSRYVQDVLSVIEGDKVTINFVNNSSPVIIKDKSDDSALFVIMPLRL